MGDNADVKDFDSIMREITAGFSADSKKDIAYLQEQMEKYKNHEMGQEIIRACGRLMYELLPDDKKEELCRLINNESSGTEATLEEVRFNIYKKNYDKALKIMEALVKKIEDMNAFQDDQVSEYHVFDEFFEEVLYQYRNKPKKDVRRAQVPYTEVYLLYGSLLVELQRIQDARVSLEKGLKWNPVSFRIMSEYMEIFKMTGDLDKFYALTLDAFKIAFHAADVGRCYRNLGYYFVEKELYSEAVAVYLLSTQYDQEAKQVQSELYYINEKTGGKIAEPSINDTKAYAEKYGFPMGADGDVLGLAFSYGKHFMEQNEANAARYFLNIVYELTDDEEIKKLIDQISEETE